MKNSEKLCRKFTGKISKIDFSKLKEGDEICKKVKAMRRMVLVPYIFHKYENNQLYVFMYDKSEKISKTNFVIAN